MIYCYVPGKSLKQHIANPFDPDRSLCFHLISSTIQGKTDTNTDVCKNCLSKSKWLNRINLK